MIFPCLITYTVSCTSASEHKKLLSGFTTTLKSLCRRDHCSSLPPERILAAERGPQLAQIPLLR